MGPESSEGAPRGQPFPVGGLLPMAGSAGATEGCADPRPCPSEALLEHSLTLALGRGGGDSFIVQTVSIFRDVVGFFITVSF